MKIENSKVVSEKILYLAYYSDAVKSIVISLYTSNNNNKCI